MKIPVSFSKKLPDGVTNFVWHVVFQTFEVLKTSKVFLPKFLWTTFLKYFHS
ncbi:hypothetical protein BGP_1154 [Beggiatoa sp. PS]|nr:hypothetical protein BGP_1154 [Beggiatoa sp. PS]